LLTLVKGTNPNDAENAYPTWLCVTRAMTILAALRQLCNGAAMGSGHHHDHPDRSAGAASHSPAFALAIALNLIFVIAEVIAGIAGRSMALLADAGHNFGDVLALVLAWGASVLSHRPPSARFTYGFKSSSILAAMANAALLWVALGAILIETIRRIGQPEAVAGSTMMVVAAMGIVINAASAILFARGRRHDLNLRAAFQHLLADAAVSGGVVVAGLLIMLTGSNWIDPATSLVITAVIAAGSWGLLRDSVKLGLLGVPDGIEAEAVRTYLLDLPQVGAVHDLHIWPMSTTETALTAHIVTADGHPGDAFLHATAHELDHRFGIGHATLQIETAAEAGCALAPEEVV
jgi:cobalt-zinc-cadmium efflux system protein